MRCQGATATGLTLCVIWPCCLSVMVWKMRHHSTCYPLRQDMYFNTHKDTRHWEKYTEEVNGCSAKQVWLLARHGTCFLTANDMALLVKLLPPLSQKTRDNHRHDRGCLKKHDLSQLTDWFPPFELQDREQLQERGQEELASIGTHWPEFLPELFNVAFDLSLFKIDFNIKNWTQQSAHHFLRGMFGEDTVGSIELPKAYSPNFILRFYKACPRWLQEVYKNNETTYKECWLFTETEHFKMVHGVSARLGFMHPLFSEEVVAMYDECRYETAWWPQQKSAWCSAFFHFDSEVMEYHQDRSDQKEKLHSYIR